MCVSQFLPLSVSSIAPLFKLSADSLSLFPMSTSLLGALAVIIPGSLYLLSSGHDNVAHNDHDAQKRLHTHLIEVEKSRYPAGRIGGKLVGIEEVVTTRHEDVETPLPADALNHPVNREKVS